MPGTLCAVMSPMLKYHRTALFDTCSCKDSNHGSEDTIYFGVTDCWSSLCIVLFYSLLEEECRTGSCTRQGAELSRSFYTTRN
jgi:hypothetical protein